MTDDAYLEPTEFDRAKAEDELCRVIAAVDVSPLAQASQLAMFAALRLYNLAAALLSEELEAGGVEEPLLAVAAMAKDEQLIEARCGPFTLGSLAGALEVIHRNYFSLIAQHRQETPTDGDAAFDEEG